MNQLVLQVPLIKYRRLYASSSSSQKERTFKFQRWSEGCAVISWARRTSISPSSGVCSSLFLCGTKYLTLHHDREQGSILSEPIPCNLRGRRRNQRRHGTRGGTTAQLLGGGGDIGGAERGLRSEFQRHLAKPHESLCGRDNREREMELDSAMWQRAAPWQRSEVADGRGPH